MKTFKKVHENKEIANKHILKIKKRGGTVNKTAKNGKILLEYFFNEIKELKAEDILKFKKTKTIMQGLGDVDDVKYWIKQYHAKTKNYKPDTYYRVEANTGYAGVGNGLYLGRDKNALKSFYDLENDNLPISEYQGNVKWLDLLDYDDYDKFEKQQGDLTNSNDISKVVLAMGFDGIRYYDPQATGEEFVLFNMKKVRKM